MNYNENRGLFKLILLTPLTFGLYAIYFWYKYASDVNLMCDGDGKHTMNYFVVLLLAPLTFGIYPLVWVKNMQDRLRSRGNEKGCNITQNGKTIVAWYTFGWILFGVGPLIGVYHEISTINQVAIALNCSPNKKAYVDPMLSTPKQYAPTPEQPSTSPTVPSFSTVSIATEAPVAQKPMGTAMCPNCHEVQYANRNTCQRCGAVMPRAMPANAPPRSQTAPQRAPERPMVAPTGQGAFAERTSYGNPIISIYPSQPVAPMQARYATPAAQSAEMASRHRRSFPSDMQPVLPDRLDERTVLATAAVRVPAGDAFPMERSTMDQRQVVNPQVGMVRSAEQPMISSWEKNIRGYQEKISALVQTLPEPKPVYLWASLAVSCMMSVIAFLVAIFR